jgi:hypothetical protein
MSDREQSYVQASRARGQCRLYTDRSEAGDEMTDLARQMSRSRQKHLAHDIERMSRREKQEQPKRFDQDQEQEIER